MTLQIVQDEAADEVLSTNAFALLCGMLLQQQVPIDLAFAGPAKILDRFGSLDPAAIAEAPPEEFAQLCAADPPIHPYPESMSVLIQALAKHVVANYGGETSALWETAGSGKQLLSRLTVFPGFNKRKAQMFIALLGKQLDIRPEGWEKAAGRFARPNIHLSVADVHDQDSLEKVSNAKSARHDSNHDESKGAQHVTSEEESPEKTERQAAKKAARKAARRAARKEANERLGSAEGADPVLDPETGEPLQGGPGRGDGAKRAAKKAAKRAARRAAKGLEPEPPGTTGPGRGGMGKKAGAGRNARKRAASAEAEGQTDDATAEADDED